MSNENKRFSVWVVINRLDLLLVGDAAKKLTKKGHCDVKEIVIGKEPHTASIKQILTAAFNIDAKNISLKLRNANGSLVPLNNRLTENCRNTPYTLEVVKFRKNVAVMSNITPITHFHQNQEDKIQDINDRIQKLENALPELKIKKMELINTEINNLEQKLNFLNQRFELAENSKWKGMFTKHPMW